MRICFYDILKPSWGYEIFLVFWPSSNQFLLANGIIVARKPRSPPQSLGTSCTYTSNHFTSESTTPHTI